MAYWQLWAYWQFRAILCEGLVQKKIPPDSMMHIFTDGPLNWFGIHKYRLGYAFSYGKSTPILSLLNQDLDPSFTTSRPLASYVGAIWSRLIISSLNVAFLLIFGENSTLLILKHSMPDTFNVRFSMWKSTSWYSEEANWLWRAASEAIAWSLWKERNSRAFNDKLHDWEFVFNETLACLWSWGH